MKCNRSRMAPFTKTQKVSISKCPILIYAKYGLVFLVDSDEEYRRIKTYSTENTCRKRQKKPQIVEKIPFYLQSFNLKTHLLKEV